MPAIKLTKEEFIKISTQKHGNEYDYSLVEYINLRTPVKIIHNRIIYEQLPSNHMKGFKPENNKKMTKEKFIDNAKKIHGNKYDYSLVNFINVRKKIKIIYNNKIYEQFAYAHLAGKCPEKIRCMKTKEQFISECKKVHGELFDYSLVDYTGGINKIKIIYDGKIYTQRAKDHVRGIYPDGCGINDSKGVRNIKKILKENNIKYFNEHSYDNCKYINLLRFDFYLPKYNILIEYDGRQHFEPNEYFGGEKKYKNQIIRDDIKNEFCEKNKITLIRISHKDDIQQIIENNFHLLKKEKS